MSEIPKAYEPQAVEDKWYQYWLDQKFFCARADSPKPAYSIVIPPPNVTGVLTLGHVLNNTIQDILARRARMIGHEVLWLPGTDHAGIATQTVVEKSLRKQGAMKHREDLGREKFLEKVWEWKEKHGGIIIQQLKKLGASCDWTRERFTMDPEYSKCVQMVFVALYEKGLIYRGKRMVNWDPAARTALSDEEVEMIEEQGHLWHFKYPLIGEDGFVVVATTRPETMLGDEAVAVHPADPRYQSLHGKKVLLPLRDKAIPIVTDELVDPKFGTGCVKVTPAHDPADYEMGQRHHLPLTVVIGPDGTMTETAGGDFAGMDRLEARKAVVAKLENLGLVLKVENYVHRVGYSQRSNVPIEPYLSEQWFLRYPAVAESTKAVETGEIKFHPERWSKTYLHWMTNIRDWCISRQLWWGHRVPVWYRGAETRCQIESPGEEWTQDTDVLDTWFSSWLWPFATMGWPEKTAALKKFYPTSDLVTGPDIIFFWVARMIMAGCEFMGEAPFRNVYFTGIIRDKQGRKMSKSLGNSPDPLELIARFGADALRFGVMRSAPLGQDVLYDEQQVELGRNFCNKLWNACRFRQMHPGEAQGEIDPQLLTNDDKWILLRLDTAIREMDAAFAEYKFSDAAATLHRFFWSEYCDWYIEASKAALQGTDAARKANTLAVTDFVLSHTLRLFHPFLPFITEELWHGMGYSADMPAEQGGKTIIFAPWPKPLGEDFMEHYGLSDEVLRDMAARQKLVIEIRNVRAQFRIPANKRLNLVLHAPSDFPGDEKAVIQLLTGADSIEHRTEYQPAKGEPVVYPAGGGKLFIPIAGLFDVEAEKARLTKELQKVEAEITKVQQKLDNPSFAEKVPPQVLQEHRQRLVDWQSKRAQLQSALDGLAS
ncbi:MAG TPA: valine--tRNA ligase [Verrucomicrobiae bacterium]|jgi:valyl-tRNA synthetase|nr:valine--tRNA ligase [Verrucomicrobiae bacterium]